MPENENFHPTTRLVDPKGERADIDVELAPLVQLLWRLGIETITCCQDVGESIAPLARDLPHVASEAERLRGSAQVDFPIDAGLRFLTAVARAGPRDDLYVRMVHWLAPGAWEVSVRAEDLAVDEDDQPSEFDLGYMMLVRFPRTDLHEILRRLEAFEKGGLYPPGPADWSTVQLVEDDA